MANQINGSLYWERLGKSGPAMVFLHPNPMDQSCWMYQMAHLSTWYQCVGIDLPGYGRSPSADPGLTMDSIAQACWEAVDDVTQESAILVGCSVGSHLIPHMFHLRPRQTRALVFSGASYNPNRAEMAARRIAAYQEQGVDFRRPYVFEDLSPEFGQTDLAHYFADLFTSRNQWADVPTIIEQFRALAEPVPENLHSEITVPSLILTGSQDKAHSRAFALQERIPGCELFTIEGAGHACMMEQPWIFDREMIRFLKKHDLFPT